MRERQDIREPKLITTKLSSFTRSCPMQRLSFMTQWSFLVFSWWCQSTFSHRCTFCKKPIGKTWESRSFFTLNLSCFSQFWSGLGTGIDFKFVTFQIVTLTPTKSISLGSISWSMSCGTFTKKPTDLISCLPLSHFWLGWNCSFTSESLKPLVRCSEFCSKCWLTWANS